MAPNRDDKDNRSRAGRSGSFRCDVCGYHENLGNEATGEGPGLRRVHWSPRYNEHQCEACFSTIAETVLENELKDKKEQEEEGTSQDDFEGYTGEAPLPGSN